MDNATNNKDKKLQWSEKELEDLSNRILRLREDQIAALLNLSGLNFLTSDIEAVVADIIENGRQSGHLPILLNEAHSKDTLLWWLEYFEKINKQRNNPQGS